MFLESLELIEKELSLQKELLKKYKDGRKGLPSGRLIAYETNNRKYYSRVRKYNGRSVTTYLGSPDKAEVKRLQTKYFLNKSIEKIESNIKLMEHFLDEYQIVEPNYLQAHFPKAYQALPAECFKLCGFEEPEKWQNCPYTKSTRHPESLKHITLKGDFVRSKAEMNIADYLFLNGIPYRYEELTKMGGITVAPDFKILDTAKQRILIHEHLGMMNDYNYVLNSLKKISTYIKSGFIPGDNLLLTYGFEGVGMNTQYIDRLYKAWFTAAPKL